MVIALALAVQLAAVTVGLVSAPAPHAYALGLSSRALLVEPVTVPSGSMKPTLLVGDHALVAKDVYWRAGPERGDVIVFIHPNSGTCDWRWINPLTGHLRSCVIYLKRVIGIGGDRIAVSAGRVVLNGQPLPLVADGSFSEPNLTQGVPPRLPRCANAPVAAGAPCVTPRLRETLPGGRSHAILDLGADTPGPHEEMAEVTVPDGTVFVMGDNRDNSVDSRFPRVGMVPVGNVLGRVLGVVFNMDGRPGRLLAAIE